MRDHREDPGLMDLRAPVRHRRRRRDGAGRRQALAFMACAAALLVPGAATTTAQIPAPATVTLHHTTLQWTTLPGHYVTAIVTHTERIRTDSRGNIVGVDGRGHGRAEADGSVDVTLNSGTGRRFLPRDAITLETSDLRGTVLSRHSLSVPELRADVAADGGTIVGKAPPGWRVQVAIDSRHEGEPATTIETSADPTGNFSVVPPDAPLVRGQGAWVSVRDQADNVFRVRVVPFSLRLMVNEAVALGWLTPANAAQIDYRTAPNDDGATFPRRINLAVDSPEGHRYGSTSWSSLLTVGAPVTVTLDSEVLPTREIGGLTIPSISIARDSGNGVAGTAPSNAALTIEVFREIRSEPTLSLTAASDGSGRWQAELPEHAFAAGNHIVVAAGWRGGPGGSAQAPGEDLGLQIAARLQLPLFTVAVDGASFVAELAPGALFEASFWSPDGVLNGSTGQLRADDEGVAALELGRELDWTEPSGELSYLNRGGVIEVDVAGGGDPVRLAIPQLHATTDLDADTVIGEAPPGSALEVEILTQDGGQRFDVQADATGGWRLDLARNIDIRPGVGARVWLPDGHGHQFYLDTAPVLIQAHADTSTLWLAPSSGRPMRAEVRDAEGRVVGTGSSFARESPDEEDRQAALVWVDSVRLADGFGANPPLAVGDTLIVRVGDDVATWVLPPLEGKIDPEIDLLVGTTIPGAAVRVIAGEPLEPLTPVVETVADGSGRFQADFAGRADLGLMGGAYVEVRGERHSMLRFIRSPAVVVHYDRGYLTGALEPRVDVTARLFEGDVVAATGTATTDGSARYSMVMRDAHGRGFALRPRQRLEIAAPAAELVPLMERELPEFDITVEGDRRTVGGARPEGYFQASVGNVHRDWPMATPYIELSEENAPTGRWQARLSRALRPGDDIQVSVYESSEHGVVRYHREPVLAIEHGGSRVCGFVPPLSQAELQLVDAGGSVKGSAYAYAEYPGIVNMQWRDAAGNLVASTAGDRVQGHIAAKPIAIDLGVFTATLSTASGEVSAQIRPGAYPILTAPGRDCMFTLSASDSAWLSSLSARAYYDSYGVWTVPEDGLISLSLPGGSLRERGVSLHFDSEDGHRIYRTIYRPLLLEADVATSEVRGTGSPGAEVELTVLDASGNTLAQSSAEADAAGQFSLGLERGIVSAGRSLLANLTPPTGGPLVVIDDETAEMEVEALDVDPSAERIIGSAPSSRRVRLILQLRDGSAKRFNLTSGEDGRFSFGAEELPPRSDWDLTDVIAGRAELDQPGGHMTVASWTTQREVAAYLPWTSAGR